MTNLQKKSLIIGIDSVIGTALQQELLQHRWVVYGSSRKKNKISSSIIYLDLENLPAVLSFPWQVNVVFLCASITKISHCRNNDRATLVNKDAQIKLAEYFLTRNTHVVFLSTSAVFSGQKPKYTIHDLPDPVTEYGKQKACVEAALLKYKNLISIVRLTKVLTPSYSLFLQWIDALKAEKIIEPFYDLTLSPVPIQLVTQALRQIAEKKILGIIHLSGQEDSSYASVAQYFLRKLNISKPLIEARSFREVGILVEEAPPYTSLDLTRCDNLYQSYNGSLLETLDILYRHLLIQSYDLL